MIGETWNGWWYCRGVYGFRQSVVYHLIHVPNGTDFVGIWDEILSGIGPPGPLAGRRPPQFRTSPIKAYGSSG
jgi:hypothetical protein